MKKLFFLFSFLFCVYFVHATEYSKKDSKCDSDADVSNHTAHQYEKIMELQHKTMLALRDSRYDFTAAIARLRLVHYNREYKHHVEKSIERLLAAHDEVYNRSMEYDQQQENIRQLEDRLNKKNDGSCEILI